MQLSDLQGKHVVIWGTGREGRAAAKYIQPHARSITFIDEASQDKSVLSGDVMGSALLAADIVIKSPGVSLYHPLISTTKQAGVIVTSLLNLWLGTPHRALTICVTGSKGKSTTSSLLAHMLRKMGRDVALVGNIGVPVCETPADAHDIVVIETSSYQAADLTEKCDIGVLTSLNEDHLDWHGSRERYHADKLNLLAHANTKIASAHTKADAIWSNHPAGLHARGVEIFNGTKSIGAVFNDYLARPHNLENICTVLTVAAHLSLDLADALASLQDFIGLPHRQQELGEKNGVLYVNDSISTTAYSAIAALDAYAARPVTLIAGGFDRGIDYTPLAKRIVQGDVSHVVLLDAGGDRIGALLETAVGCHIHKAATMRDAVAIAQDVTATGGVILLSPGAPSYGMFRDFVDRGLQFSSASGFAA